MPSTFVSSIRLSLQLAASYVLGLIVGMWTYSQVRAEFFELTNLSEPLMFDDRILLAMHFVAHYSIPAFALVLILTLLNQRYLQTHALLVCAATPAIACCAALVLVAYEGIVTGTVSRYSSVPDVAFLVVFCCTGASVFFYAIDKLFSPSGGPQVEPK